MGKHDKTNFEWSKPEAEPEKISYDPPKDDFYKARIRTLETENRSLNRELEAMQDKEEKLNGVIAELNEAIAILEIENTKLKDAYIRQVIA